MWSTEFKKPDFFMLTNTPREHPFFFAFQVLRGRDRIWKLGLVLFENEHQLLRAFTWVLNVFLVFLHLHLFASLLALKTRVRCVRIRCADGHSALYSTLLMAFQCHLPEFLQILTAMDSVIIWATIATVKTAVPRYDSFI